MFPASCSKCFSISLYLCSFHVPFTSFHVHFMCLWFYVLSLKKQNVSVKHIFVLRSFWWPSDFSFSVRLLFFLIFLSCPFHFTLLSLQFPSFCPSSHSFFLYVLSFLSWFLPVSFEYSICESILSARNAFSSIKKMFFWTKIFYLVQIHYSLWPVRVRNQLLNFKRPTL